MKIVSFICMLIILILAYACGGTSTGKEGRVKPTIITIPIDSIKIGSGIAITRDNQVAVLNEDGTWEEYRFENAATSLERWQAIEVSPNVLEFFKQLFGRVGVHVIDTGEQFTTIVKETKVEFIEDIDENNVDYVVEIYSYQVDLLANYISNGELSDIEQFRILKVLVKSEIKGANNPLNNPLMSSSIFRWLIRGKNVLHVNLISPDPELEGDGHFTFLHADGWVVIEGLHGTPQRVLNVSLENALELQIKFYESMKANSWTQWYKTAKWYKKWRKKVSQPISEG